MARIAIMEGRLLPPSDGRFQCFPRERWREEFAFAVHAGLDAIEWIYDEHGSDVNPLGTGEGLAEMQGLSSRHKVAVVSVCADYFMDHPFATASPVEFDELKAKLGWLIGRCEAAGIVRMVLPFVDASRIETPEQETRIAEMLLSVAPQAEKSGVELHLETALDPAGFRALLGRLPHPILKVNYDSGNSSSLGYDPREELAAYGPRIGSVHIKDRVCGGGTVPLGTGSANIPALLSGLSEIRYTGDYVLQVARGAEGAEVEWARQNRLWLVRELERAQAVAARGLA